MAKVVTFINGRVLTKSLVGAKLRVRIETKILGEAHTLHETLYVTDVDLGALDAPLKLSSDPAHHNGCWRYDLREIDFKWID